MRKTRALRAAATLAATLFFLKGECALAQDWRVIASYGQASAPRSQGFAEAGTLSLARDFSLGSGFSWGVEFTPLFVVNQTRVDLPGRPREVAYAAAVSPLLAWDYLPRHSSVGLRLEGGVGIFRGFSPIPAEGSRFNFLAGFAGLVLVRAGSDHLVSLGVRRAHVSNSGLAGKDNPGLSFYSGVAGVSWPAR